MHLLLSLRLDDIDMCIRADHEVRVIGGEQAIHADVVNRGEPVLTLVNLDEAIDFRIHI